MGLVTCKETKVDLLRLNETIECTYWKKGREDRGLPGSRVRTARVKKPEWRNGLESLWVTKKIKKIKRNRRERRGYNLKEEPILRTEEDKGFRINDRDIGIWVNKELSIGVDDSTDYRWVDRIKSFRTHMSVQWISNNYLKLNVKGTFIPSKTRSLVGSRMSNLTFKETV